MDKGQIHIFLSRHGNTFEAGQIPTQVGLKTDLPLTEQGRAQALAFAAYLKQNQITPAAIYAGSLQRQTAYAQIIAQELDMESKLHLFNPALNEIDYGAWEGLTADEITRSWPEVYAAWIEQASWANNIFRGSLEAHIQAIKTWLEELRHQYTQGDVVVGVTSNGIMRFFQSFDVNLWNSAVQNARMEDLKVKTGHFCELLLSQDSLIVKSWNQKP